MFVYEISFEDDESSKTYVAAKSKKAVVEDLKGSFGEDLADRVRKLSTKEIAKLNFVNRAFANRALKKGTSKTFILSQPRKLKQSFQDKHKEDLS